MVGFLFRGAGGHAPPEAQQMITTRGYDSSDESNDCQFVQVYGSGNRLRDVQTIARQTFPKAVIPDNEHPTLVVVTGAANSCAHYLQDNETIMFQVNGELLMFVRHEYEALQKELGVNEDLRRT